MKGDIIDEVFKKVDEQSDEPSDEEVEERIAKMKKDKLEEEIAKILYEDRKLTHKMLYETFIIFKSFLIMLSEDNADYENSLLWGYHDYIEEMVDFRLKRYGKFDKPFGELNIISKTAYRVLADQIMEKVKEND